MCTRVYGCVRVCDHVNAAVYAYARQYIRVYCSVRVRTCVYARVHLCARACPCIRVRTIRARTAVYACGTVFTHVYDIKREHTSFYAY